VPRYQSDRVNHSNICGGYSLQLLLYAMLFNIPILTTKVILEMIETKCPPVFILNVIITIKEKVKKSSSKQYKKTTHIKTKLQISLFYMTVHDFCLHI
jgi:hypothetical protein